MKYLLIGGLFLTTLLQVPILAVVSRLDVTVGSFMSDVFPPYSFGERLRIQNLKSKTVLIGNATDKPVQIAFANGTDQHIAVIPPCPECSKYGESYLRHVCPTEAVYKGFFLEPDVYRMQMTYVGLKDFNEVSLDMKKLESYLTCLYDDPNSSGLLRKASSNPRAHSAP